MSAVAMWVLLLQIVSVVVAPAVLAAVPTITSFSPTSGPPGTTVTITGTGFTGTTAVRFAGVNASSFTVVSDTQITAVVPATAETGAIQVVNPDGTATSNSSFTVTPAAPTVTSFTPTSGPPGTSVTINGTGFTNVTSVTFNGVPATFTVTNSGRIVATVPTNATTGRITVNTTHGSGTSATNFTVTQGAPVITSFTPTNGPVGTTVVLSGSGFTGTITVRFDGVSAPFTVNSPTQITTTVPSGATTGRITVTTNNGTATSSTDFVVTTAPTVTSFTPTSGAPGTSVTITGTNFTGATAVTFGGVQAQFTVNSSTRITAIVPNGAVTGRIRVFNAAGTGTSSTDFAVAPAITSFTPTNGPIGTSVVISGTGFTGVSTVSFNGVLATFVVNSPTQITATVPASATTGPIRVNTAAGTGTSSTDYVVTVVPTITSFTPTTGPPGTSVTINGTGFTGVTAVTFNGTQAQYTVNSPTRITATVPNGATTGRIRVVNSAGVATSATDFTVGPTVTSFSPGFGRPGTSVIITGTDFTGATAVTFNGVATTFTVDSPTQITAAVPAGATTGRIAVTGPGGTGASPSDFIVTQVHDRSISLRLRGHLIADGRLRAPGAPPGCLGGVTVTVQKKRRSSGNWFSLRTTTTAPNGTWAVRIPDRTGRYRARVFHSATTTDICRGTRSVRRIHRHR